MDELIDLIRQEAATVAGMRNWRGTVVVTAYDPDKHAMKGMLVPHEVETGWIPIGAGAIGNGYGDALAPKVGDAQKLDGDQFSVQFDAGDANTLVATHRIFSDEDKPPRLEAGEMVRMHSSGTKVFHDKDGQLIVEHGPSQNTFKFATDKSVTITHAPSGSVFQIDADGNHVHDLQGKAMTIKNHSNLAITGNVTIEGVATLNSLPISTS